MRRDLISRIHSSEISRPYELIAGSGRFFTFHGDLTNLDRL